MLFYIFCFLTLAYAVAILFPETRIGQTLHTVLIKGVAGHLNRMTWTKVFYLMALAIGAVAFSYAALPAEIAMMAAADWAVYAEIMAALTVTNISARLSVLFAPVCHAVAAARVRMSTALRRPRVRQAKPAVARRPPSFASDDDAAVDRISGLAWA